MWTPGNLSSYATAEAETMKWLQQLIQEATDCCQGSNLRSSEECVFSGLGRKNYYQFNNKRYYTGDTLFVPRQDKVIKLPAFLENETPFKAPMTIWKGASAGIGSNAIGEFRTNVTSANISGSLVTAVQKAIHKRVGLPDSIVIDSVSIRLVMVSTTFVENTNSIYGYDENNDSTELYYSSYIKNVAWKSIADDGSFDEFTLKVEPKAAAKKVKLFLGDSINFKLSRRQATNLFSRFSIATNKIIRTETFIKPMINGVIDDSARLNIKSYTLVKKTISVVTVNEKSDDYQIVSKNDSVPSQFTRVISWGINKQIETRPLGDDQIIWDPINNDSVIVAGKNRLVETKANDRTILSSRIDLVALGENLNQVYRHALVKWLVDTNKYEKSINFDLNRDGKLDITSADVTKEMKRIQDSCAINNGNQILYIITFPTNEKTTSGKMPFAQRFGFVFNVSDFQTTAHELGHGTFSLRHPWSQFPRYPNRGQGNWKSMDTFNLMEWSGRGWTRDKLRKYQWDQCH